MVRIMIAGPLELHENRFFDVFLVKMLYIQFGCERRAKIRKKYTLQNFPDKQHTVRFARK